MSPLLYSFNLYSNCVNHLIYYQNLISKVSQNNTCVNIKDMCFTNRIYGFGVNLFFSIHHHCKFVFYLTTNKKSLFYILKINYMNIIIALKEICRALPNRWFQHPSFQEGWF